MGPINTRDPATAARAYTVLGWPIAIGERYRPRQGCTCGNTQCPAPGAHPIPGEPPAVGYVDWDIETAPGAALIAPTVAFDALVMPRRMGMAIMVSLDRDAPVPCLVDEEHATILVLPSTGRYALGCTPPAGVRLRTGADQWIALPPSHGIRWDTPPWNEQTRRRLPLLHGGDVRGYVVEAAGHAAAQAGGCTS